MPAFVICTKDVKLERTLSRTAKQLGQIENVDTWDACCTLLAHEDSGILVVDADPWNDEEDWLGRVARLQPFESRLIIIMLSPDRRAENAIAAIGHGCFEYLIKPINERHLADVLSEAARIASKALTRRPELLGGRASGIHSSGLVNNAATSRHRLIGQSPAMLRVYKQIGQAAPNDVEVLVTGESGTGKELVCRAIHDNSPRKDHPFVAINCAAIPDTLLESELFGHEKGAFTGAERRRIGKFEQAEGGTILLDEIGDMSPVLQAKLLRLVQDRSFYRVGGNELLHADVRLLAATHQPLEQRIAERAFRADLFYRLRVMHIDLAPLRQRDEDIIILAHHFAAVGNREMNRAITAFHPETNAILLRHTWPGNVRELQNVIKQAMVVAQGPTLLPQFLPTMAAVSIPDTATTAQARPAAVDLTSQPSVQITSPFDARAAAAASLHVDSTAVHESIEEMMHRILHQDQTNAYRVARDVMESVLIVEAMRLHQGNASAAARHLGLTRLTLRRKLDALESPQVDSPGSTNPSP